MSDFEIFKEKLSSKETFYSSLTDRKSNGKEYCHVLNVWNEFEIKTTKDYYNLHLKRDCSLLANVFEKFTNIRLKTYGLYQIHYLSTPGLSWGTMLQIAKIKLELIPDPDMYIFLKKGTRRGTTYVSNRCSKANKKCLKFYHAKKNLNFLYT